ncbi:MAG: response regulator transcription factor, partial [Sutterella wadsworthensis]
MFTSMPNPDLYSPLARIIDDEETVRNSEAFMLRMGGINAVAYESAEEFLARDDLRHPGCLVLDVRMPGMSGLELQEEMTRRGIDLPILFLS